MPSTTAPRVAVIGGGPGGLMAAEVLATAGVSVTVFERMPSVGRKFLLAGRGGLNLTHSEPMDIFSLRYGRAAPRLRPALDAFGPADLRAWCAGLGQVPFVGTSGRVFPSGFRATPLLRAWLRRLDDLGVDIRTRHTWEGWGDEAGTIALRDAAGEPLVWPTDAVVLALGGASWPRTGSDGSWVPVIESAGLDVAPLRPANCGFEVAWSGPFAERFAGTPVKGVRVSHAGASAPGDVMITATGIEGGPVYAMAAGVRDALLSGRPATLTVDLRPDVAVDALAAHLARGRDRDSVSTALRRTMGLTAAAIGLMREAVDNRLPTDARGLARLVKAVPVRVVAVQAIDRAISTAGGVAFADLDEHLMMRSRPGTFVAGEMLDWEAPTGGYLLQATFSTGVAAARGALAWLDRAHADNPAFC